MDIEKAKKEIYYWLQELAFMANDKKQKDHMRQVGRETVMPLLLRVELFLYSSDINQTILDVSEAAEVFNRNALKGDIPLMMEMQEEWTPKDFAAVLRHQMGQWGLSYR